MLDAILISLVGIIATIDYNGPLLNLHRPLFTGAMTGLILGDFTQGLIIGATLELTWLGVTGIGGYTPPDTITGAILGTALGISAGEGIAGALAIAVPVSVITQQLDVLAKTVTIRFSNSAIKDADSGDYSNITRYQYSALAVITLFKVVPIFLAVYLGTPFVERVFELVPEFVIQGMNVATGILPAVGFAMLLNMMIEDNLWIFVLIGFFLVAFGNMSTIAVAIAAIIVAYFYDLILQKDSNDTDGTDNTDINKQSAEGEYDL